MKSRSLKTVCPKIISGLKQAVKYAARASGLWLAALTFLGMSAGAQDTNWVTLGNYQADANRIIAKYKLGMAGASSTENVLRQTASQAHREFSLVPGLVVLHETNGLGRAIAPAAEESMRRAHLLNRIQALRQSGLFEYVEPDYIVHTSVEPTDSSFTHGDLWGLMNYGQNGGKAGADISATNAWDLTTGSANVIVAVIDTGIRYTHQDLKAQMWKNPKPGSYPPFQNDTNGINAITGTGDPMDDNDHGTHVSGTIGAMANGGGPMVGVTWKVQLMGCKFLSAGGSGRTSDAITCIDYATFNNARIMNNSWGGGGYSQGLYDAIGRARAKGVLFVAAAGNDGADNDQVPHYPANYGLDNIISVAALDRNDNLASFSDYGATTVHIGAPGVDILSCSAAGDSAYMVMDGTSMATPHVTGVAALILSLYPSADLSELRQRILQGAVPIPSLNGYTTTGGRLNAYKSLTLSGKGFLQMAVNPPSGSALLQGSTQPIFVKVTDVFGVGNATVTASIAGSTNLTFLNNGAPPDVISNDATYSVNFSVPASTNTITMTVWATATNKFGVTNVITYSVLPPPPNDMFASAIKVPPAGGAYQANNRFATLESGEPIHGGVPAEAGSLWWVWTPANTTNVFIETTGSQVDNILAVYTNGTLPSLGLVSADASNLAGHKQATVSFTAIAGQAYSIAIASIDTNNLGSVNLRVAPGGQPDTTPPQIFVTTPMSGDTLSSDVVTLQGVAVDPAPNATGIREVLVSVNGSIASTAQGTTNWTAPALLQPGFNTVQVSGLDLAGNFSSIKTLQLVYFLQDPPNDFFAAATSLTGAAGTVSGNNTNATKEANEPDHAGNHGGKSVWWSFLAPADGLLTLSTTNSTFDTLLGLYTGSAVGNLTAIAANDDAYPNVSGGFSLLSQAVHGGETYYIAVDGYNGASGTIQLAYNFTPAPLHHVTATSLGAGSVQLATTNSLGGLVVAPANEADFAENAAVLFSATPNSYYLFSAWSGYMAATANPLTVVVKTNIALAAAFQPVQFTDGFESGDLFHLGWSFGGNAPWVTQSNVVAAGKWAARSGVIGNSKTSSLILSTNFQAGTASFDYRVSCEPSFDTLTFLVDGAPLQQWSGEAGWATFVFSLTATNHVLEWRYSKDVIGSAGLDAAFIDNVNLPFGIPVDATTPAHLTMLRGVNGSYTLYLRGQTNQIYVLQTTVDFAKWSSVSTNTAVGGLITYPISVSDKLQFYRAVVP